MQSKIRFSSVRLMIVLFISACTVLMLYNVQNIENSTFANDIAGVIIGLLICLLYAVPSIIIKLRTKKDFISFAKTSTPSAVIFVSSYYAMYFAYLATGFLIRYCDLFSKSLNPDANKYVIAALLLAVCTYAAHKGICALSRVALFIFVFSIIAFLIIFGGNISNFDFSSQNFDIQIDYNAAFKAVSFFSSISFITVIFAFNSQNTNKFKKRHIILAIAAIFVLAALSLVFIYFVLSGYGRQQAYQMFILSKTSHFSFASGMDSFFLAAVTSFIFILISAVFTSVKNSAYSKGSKLVLNVFAVIVFILFVCAQRFNVIEDILTDYNILNVLNFVSAVLIPTCYMIIFRRRLSD